MIPKSVPCERIVANAAGTRIKLTAEEWRLSTAFQGSQGRILAQVRLGSGGERAASLLHG